MLLLKQNPRVLAIGSHPDDIELGAGGFVFRLTQQYRATVHFLILTAGVQSRGPKNYEPSSRQAEARDAAKELGSDENPLVKVLQFADCNLHLHGHEIIGKIEDELRTNTFDLVMTHAGEDTHADHRAVHESTLSAVRDFPGAVLLYQAPSTKPNGFRPTFFVNLDDGH